eukprot:CAMPEP_0115144572 /NCGR_PEP_ID=MMETSP0227-20121206/61594_1 /TAXON_ID=89957 /ORGANISM="Polarella glacialis, Strain CCMP 1383" /LENGTH=93 /DNA_ID=CAMNT_0002553913 /DNA_START=199 /DNA_END=477 /DNA_ORIENTATION=+
MIPQGVVSQERSVGGVGVVLVDHRQLQVPSAAAVRFPAEQLHGPDALESQVDCMTYDQTVEPVNDGRWTEASLTTLARSLCHQPGRDARRRGR